MLDLRRICWILPNYVFRSPRCQTFLWQLFQPCSWSKSSNFAFPHFSSISPLFFKLPPFWHTFFGDSTFQGHCHWSRKLPFFGTFGGHCRKMFAWQWCKKKYVVTLNPCSKKISSGPSLIPEIEIWSPGVVNFNLITSKMEFGLWWGQIISRTEQKIIPECRFSSK